MTNYCFHTLHGGSMARTPVQYIIISNFGEANEIESFAKLVSSGNATSCSRSLRACRPARPTYFLVRVRSRRHNVSKIDVALPKFTARTMRELRSSEIPNFRPISRVTRSQRDPFGRSISPAKSCVFDICECQCKMGSNSAVGECINSMARAVEAHEKSLKGQVSS